MTNQQSEKKLLQQISNGTYRHHYLLYNRKSTDEPDNQKNSLVYQRHENTAFVKREELQIAPITVVGFCTSGVVSEKHSGFKEGDELSISDEGFVQYRIDRPKFQRLLQHLSRGHFKGIVCLCWDRISRNQGDDTIVRKLMRKGVDVRFVYATYDDSSAGELHMDVDGMFAKHHSRVTSEKVTLSTRNSRAQGKCTYRAPIGYLNPGSMEHKPFDPERAPIIKEMFELYATGDWSLADLARHATKQGLTTVPGRRRRTKEEMLADEDEEVVIDKITRPITENYISRILSSPFYTGKIIGPDGTYIKSASHEALVSDEVFNHVQAVLRKKTVSVHYTEKLDHPLRGVVRCAHCQRVYSPYTKKGILYFNVRCPKDCPNTLKNCNLTFITDRIKELIAGLHFTDNELADFEARADTDISLLEEKRHQEYEQQERQKKRIREDLHYLRGNRLALLKSGAYTPEGIVKEETKLEAELDALRDAEDISEAAMRDTVKDVAILSELLKDVVPYYDYANPQQKERIIKNLFSELYLAHDTLQYKLQNGYEGFDDRLSAICAPLAWLAELYRDREYITSNIRSLREFGSQGASKITKCDAGITA